MQPDIRSGNRKWFPVKHKYGFIFKIYHAMKTLVWIVLSGAALWTAPRLCQSANCAGLHQQSFRTAPLGIAEPHGLTRSDTTIAILQISGMDCAGCASMIHKSLSRMAGVYADEVKYPGDQAVVTFDENRIKPPQMIQAIRQLGYTAKLISCRDEK